MICYITETEANRLSASNYTAIAHQFPSTTIPIEPTDSPDNEAPRGKPRGIKAEFSKATRPSLFELRRVLRAFISVAAYSAEVATSATKAGSYGVFGDGE